MILNVLNCLDASVVCIAREDTDGVAGGRGHPDLTGSAKPGLSCCRAPGPGGARGGPPGGPEPVRPT